MSLGSLHKHFNVIGESYVGQNINELIASLRVSCILYKQQNIYWASLSENVSYIFTG